MGSKKRRSRKASCYTGRKKPPAAVIAGGVLVVLGLLFRFNPGMRFAGFFSGFLALCFLGWAVAQKWASFSSIGKACKGIYLAGIAAVVLLLGILEFQIIRESTGDEPDTTVAAVIVLGAGVNGETPSLSLQTRIDAAGAYLLAHPELPAILSGGQGAGEAITEAEAMRRGLTELGIEEDRLFLEEQSTTTQENFQYSAELLAEKGIAASERVAVVSSDFHLYRAKLNARRVGLAEPVGIPAELPWWWLQVNYFTREAFATVKTMVFD